MMRNETSPLYEETRIELSSESESEPMIAMRYSNGTIQHRRYRRGILHIGAVFFLVFLIGFGLGQRWDFQSSEYIETL